MELQSLQSVAEVDVSIRKYLKHAMCTNTKKAYKTDLSHFCQWGGGIPCTPDILASYLATYAGTLSCATLNRRIASIAKMHKVKGLSSPASSEIVKMTMRGIRRQHGRPQTQAAPLCRDDLLLVLSAIPNDFRGCRDKALLFIGFCAAMRRSELCRIRQEDLTFTPEGLVLTLPRSKTDQTGEGRKIGIPPGRGRVCPVRILKEWLTLSGITSGYVFRGIDKGAVTEAHLCDRTISNIIKARVGSVGLPPEKFSGHSLRAGLATSAVQQGKSSLKIREITGHKSEAMLARYVRDGDIFRDNAAALF